MNDKAIRSMFTHLSATYSPAEAVEILSTRYPEHAGDITILLTEQEVPAERKPAKDRVEDVLKEIALAEVDEDAELDVAGLKDRAEDVEVDAKVVDQQKLVKAAKAKVAKPKAAKAKAVKAPKAKPAKADKGPSKMDQARALYAASSDKSRKAMIAVFTEKLGLGTAAASTYFYTVKG